MIKYGLDVRTNGQGVIVTASTRMAEASFDKSPRRPSGYEEPPFQFAIKSGVEPSVISDLVTWP